MEKPVKYFNIRVYAIIINEMQEVLLSDEFRMGMYMVKFPGGGLQFGEGPADCIKREAMEEFGQEIEIIRHFYTTDFFQKALFYEDHQLISIYYRAKFTKPPEFKIAEKPFDFESTVEGNQSFRWVSIAGMNQETVHFPVDRKVVDILKKEV